MLLMMPYFIQMKGLRRKERCYENLQMVLKINQTASKPVQLNFPYKYTLNHLS